MPAQATYPLGKWRHRGLSAPSQSRAFYLPLFCFICVNLSETTHSDFKLKDNMTRWLVVLCVTTDCCCWKKQAFVKKWNITWRTGLHSEPALVIPGACTWKVHVPRWNSGLIEMGSLCTPEALHFNVRTSPLPRPIAAPCSFPAMAFRPQAMIAHLWLQVCFSWLT